MAEWLGWPTRCIGPAPVRGDSGVWWKASPRGWWYWWRAGLPTTPLCLDVICWKIAAGIPVSLAAPSIATLYRAKVDYRDALVVAISQSGESTDTKLRGLGSTA